MFQNNLVSNNFHHLNWDVYPIGLSLSVRSGTLPQAVNFVDIATAVKSQFALSQAPYSVDVNRDGH